MKRALTAVASPLLGLLAFAPPANADFGSTPAPISFEAKGAPAPPQAGAEPLALTERPTGGLQAPLPPFSTGQPKKCPKGKRKIRREGRALCVGKNKANKSGRQGR